MNKQKYVFLLQEAEREYQQQDSIITCTPLKELFSIATFKRNKMTDSPYNLILIKYWMYNQNLKNPSTTFVGREGRKKHTLKGRGESLANCERVIL